MAEITFRNDTRRYALEMARHAIDATGVEGLTNLTYTNRLLKLAGDIEDWLTRPEVK